MVMVMKNIYALYLAIGLMAVVPACKSGDGLNSAASETELQSVLDKNNYYLYLKKMGKRYGFEVCQGVVSETRIKVQTDSCVPALVNQKLEPVKFAAGEIITLFSPDELKVVDELIMLERLSEENSLVSPIEMWEDAMKMTWVGSKQFPTPAGIALFVGGLQGFTGKFFIAKLSMALAMGIPLIVAAAHTLQFSSLNSRFTEKTAAILAEYPQYDVENTRAVVIQLNELKELEGAWEQIVSDGVQPEQVDSVTELLHLMMLYFYDALPNKQVRGYCYPREGQADAFCQFFPNIPLINEISQNFVRVKF